MLKQQNSMTLTRSFVMISLITIVAIIGLGIKEYTSQKAHLTSKMSLWYDSTSDRLAAIMATPLWNFDIVQLMNITKSEIEHHPSISSIFVKEKTITGQEKLVICNKKDASGQLISCQEKPSGDIQKLKKISYENNNIGSLEISFSQEQHHKEARDILKSVILRYLFLIVIVIAGLFMAARSLC